MARSGKRKTRQSPKPETAVPSGRAKPETDRNVGPDEPIGETADSGVDPTLVGATSTRVGSDDQPQDGERGVAVIPLGD